MVADLADVEHAQIKRNTIFHSESLERNKIMDQ